MLVIIRAWIHKRKFVSKAQIHKEFPLKDPGSRPDEESGEGALHAL